MDRTHSRNETQIFFVLYKIYKLFPYSSPNYDPQLSRDEALNSLKNLNTRLLNLQKINKSLDTFINESNQLNWEDLQKINIEIMI